MNKQEVNAQLKELGFGFVKVSLNHYDDKVHRNWQGKTSKGIRGGSKGPMTMTSAHLGHNSEVETKLMATFPKVKKENDIIEIMFDDKGKENSMKFHWETFPTNDRSMDLDDSYETYWLVKIK